jgi:hypothetical protein
MQQRSFPVMLVTVLMAVLATLIFASTAGAQASFPGGAYSQDFNTLATSGTGTSDTLPTGWAFSEDGTSANTTYAAGTGSSNTGNTYSFGVSSSPPERAFGELTSDNVQSTLGVQFQNTVGRTIGGLTIGFVCEQWRYGGRAQPASSDSISFQYSRQCYLPHGRCCHLDRCDRTELQQHSHRSGDIG